MTSEIENKIREVENKNLEYENEIQSLREELSSSTLKNNEHLDIISRLNIRLKEQNNLVYDFSRDKAQDEIMNMNKSLVREIDKAKSEKMMAEVELNKLKDIVYKMKLRASKTKSLRENDAANSPMSFEFDGDNEVFGDSFLIDQSNKELEEKIRQYEEKAKASEVQKSSLERTVEMKNKQISELEAQLEELEVDLKAANQK